MANKHREHTALLTSVPKAAVCMSKARFSLASFESTWYFTSIACLLQFAS